MCPNELYEHSFVWKSHMRHQPIFVAAYVKHHAVIAYEIDGGSKHRFYITRSMPLGPLNRRIPSTKRAFGLVMPVYLGKTLFAQIMDFLPWKTFHRIVDRYSGDHRTRSLSCAEQFRVMAFAQLTYRESLRDIEVCAATARRCATYGIDVPLRTWPP
jgi:hypothetical protein